jgi:hypothetical protein
MVILILAVMGIWALTGASASGADNASRTANIHDGVRPVDVEEGIFELQPAKGNSNFSFITNRESLVVLGPYRVKGIVRHTRVLDGDGNAVDEGYLKPGQRVRVRGFQVSESTVFAASVQVVGKGLEGIHRTIESLEPLPTH